MTDQQHDNAEHIALMARDARLLDADGCAFLLSMRDRNGRINRRGFLERVAVKPSFPKAVDIPGVGRRWPRDAVVQWIADEARIAAKRVA